MEEKDGEKEPEKKEKSESHSDSEKDSDDDSTKNKPKPVAKIVKQARKPKKEGGLHEIVSESNILYQMEQKVKLEPHQK